MKKKRQKTIAKLTEEAATLLQLLVRVKYADKDGIVSCVTCGARRYYKDGMQGGHFISRKHLSTKLVEENLHPQCQYCNLYLRGNMINYTLFMEDTYGRDFVDYLLRLKNEPRKYTREELHQIKQDFQNTIKLIQKEKGI